MTTRDRLTVAAGGAVVAALYLVAVVVTAGGGHQVRPLFDSVGPPPPYQWVNPPAIFKAANVKPSTGHTTIPVQNGKTLAVTVTTPDQQFLSSLPQGAVPLEPGTGSVLATVTPLDPTTLGPVPAGLVPDGNAYRLELELQPSDHDAGPLSQPGDLVLSVPSPATTLLFSVDGKSWESHAVTHSTTGSSTASMQFNRAGFFLAAGAPGSVPVGVAGTRSSTGTVVLLVIIVIVLAAVLGLGPVLVRRLRRPTPVPGRGRSGRRPPPARRPPPRGPQNRRTGPPPKKRRR